MRPRKVSARTAGRLEDEICRQMLRLDAGRSSARLLLAIALLKAWATLEGQPDNCGPRQWLRRLTPVCLRMIEEACEANCGSSYQEDLTGRGQPSPESGKMP